MQFRAYACLLVGVHYVPDLVARRGYDHQGIDTACKQMHSLFWVYGKLLMLFGSIQLLRLSKTFSWPLLEPTARTQCTSTREMRYLVCDMQQTEAGPLILGAAQLTNSLPEGQRVTIFAPTDVAFQEAADKFGGDLPQDALADVRCPPSFAR